MRKGSKENRMAKQIYVVMGTTGEYSDRIEWPVHAYFDKEQAEEHVVRADRRAKEAQAVYDSWYAVGRGSGNRFPTLPDNAAFKDEDPNFQADYTGTYYYIIEVPI
jgi:hypothetical protein